MMHPDTELRFVGNSIGLGVFAKKTIPKGTIVYVADPLEIVIHPKKRAKTSAAINALIDKYSYIDQKGRYILSWDHAKYVNHSCEPNSISTGYGFEIAIRDIDCDEQITDEYGLLNMETPMNCECGAKSCRGIISREDSKKYSHVWDKQIQEALSHFHQVQQPLVELYPHPSFKKLSKYLSSSKNYLSVQLLSAGALSAC